MYTELRYIVLHLPCCIFRGTMQHILPDLATDNFNNDGPILTRRRPGTHTEQGEGVLVNHGGGIFDGHIASMLVFGVSRMEQHFFALFRTIASIMSISTKCSFKECAITTPASRSQTTRPLCIIFYTNYPFQDTIASENFLSSASIM